MQDSNIILHVSEDPFARVNKNLLNDPEVPWAAKGIMAYLLGKPPGWKLRVSDIVKHGPMKAGGVRAALNRLRAAGYAIYEQGKADGGRFSEGRWRIADTPIFKGLRSNPPRCGFPNAENSNHSKNEESKNEGKKESAPLSRVAAVGRLVPEVKALGRERTPANLTEAAAFAFKASGVPGPEAERIAEAVVPAVACVAAKVADRLPGDAMREVWWVLCSFLNSNNRSGWRLRDWRAAFLAYDAACPEYNRPPERCAGWVVEIVRKTKTATTGKGVKIENQFQLEEVF